MNLFGNFETVLHRELADKHVVFRNFGWPADEVGVQQRPANYTTIDDPLKAFAPDRDHEHGRLYRLVYKNNPLIEPGNFSAKRCGSRKALELTPFDSRVVLE